MRCSRSFSKLSQVITKRGQPQQNTEGIDIMEAFKARSRTVSSLEELVRTEGRKPWMVIRYLLEHVTSSSSPDEELMWCPRTDDFVHCKSCVTAFPEREGFPGDMAGEISFRGIVMNNYIGKKLFIKNPLTKKYATVSLPRTDPRDDFMPINYTNVGDDGFYLAAEPATPNRDASFQLYSSFTKEWRACSSSLEDKEDKEHSLSDFLGAAMHGLPEKESGDFTFYNPVYDSWKRIPLHDIHQDHTCSMLHDYQGRLYVLVYQNCSRFKVLVYSEELKSWSSLCDWKTHREPECSESGVILKGDGPYVYAYVGTSLDEPAFLMVFDLENLCWYHGEMPFMCEALSYTPTPNRIP